MQTYGQHLGPLHREGSDTMDRRISSPLGLRTFSNPYPHRISINVRRIGTFVKFKEFNVIMSNIHWILEMLVFPFFMQDIYSFMQNSVKDLLDKLASKMSEVIKNPFQVNVVFVFLNYS